MGDATEEALISDAQKGFLQQLVLVKESEDYHGLIISCEGRQWKVHRVVVCAHSEYFRKACSPTFKEGETQSIQLKEEDPNMVDALVDYLYCFDYTDGRQVQSAVQSSGSNTLSINANMYIIGDKYNLRDLKPLAKQKFQTALSRS